jgi:hypothetical protein
VFTVLAFGALSTNTVLAAHHHGHHANGGETGQTGTNTQGISKSPTTSESTADQSGLRPKSPTKTGVSVDAGPGSQQSGSGTAIDTRITVNQGRPSNKLSYGIKGAIRDVIQHPLKPKTGNEAGTAQINNLYVRGRQLVSPSGRNSSMQRNAIGAVVERRVTIQQGGPPDPVRHGSGTQQTGAQGSGVQETGLQGSSTAPTIEMAKLPVGITSTNNSNEPQFQHHDPASRGAVVPPIGGPSINGTGMIRPGQVTGALGGSAKTYAGVINGTGFRTRHP